MGSLSATRESEFKADPTRRRIALHLTRVLLFVAIIALIHLQHKRMRFRRQQQPPAPIKLDVIRKFFPEAHSLADGERGRREVRDEADEVLGYVVQTSPDCDHLIGFSGPTNTLIAFGPDDRIAGVDVLWSGDTKEHVAQVIRNDQFLGAFNGLTRDNVTEANVDAVSGATLTSLAIQESIIHRLSGRQPSLRFPDPLTVDDAQAVFESAHRVEQDQVHPALWRVKNGAAEEIGTILRTTPFADNIVGYQGPTEARICFDPSGRVVRIAIGKSYDNEPYVRYVRGDDYFLTLFNDLNLDELARLDLEEAEVEGVSGATMTSMAVAQGLVAAAERHMRDLESARATAEPMLNWTLRDFGTAAVILAGVLIALTSLRGKRQVLVGFQLLLIFYLGLVNGDILSQAMIAGWAQTGVPWRNAGGLVLLTAAAFALPITTRRNVYCTHLCPHGAAQQLLKNRVGWRLRLPGRLHRLLKTIPALLLVWCVLVAAALLPFSLADVEPFDAWVFYIAGWPTIIIAVVGLAASLFVPMAYCRYGCPTGAMLGYLRFNSRSDRWTPRDWFAVLLVLLACGISAAT